MPSVAGQIWSLAIVGTGSSAAYYVATVDLERYPSVLAIGQGDPWNGPRGYVAPKETDDPAQRGLIAKDPTRFINHPLHLIAHFRKTIPGFNNALVDRIKWAEMNAEVLAACEVEVANAEVKVVEEAAYPPALARDGIDPPPKGFKIALKDGKDVYAHKVVMATGTGGHRIPDGSVGCGGCKEAKAADSLHVVDLDEFARLGPAELGANTSVMVLGANAAIDAIQKSIYYKCKLSWLIDGKTDTAKLPILDSQPTVREKVKNDPSMFVRYDAITVKATGNDKVSVDVTVKGQLGKNYRVDYFVYGVGPTGSTTQLIASGIQEKLKPIFDKNQGMSTGEAILGFEAEGTGLLEGFEVIGALAGTVGRDWSKNQKAKLKQKIDSLRSWYTFWTRMRVVLPASSLLLMAPDELVDKKRNNLYRDLCNDKNLFVKAYCRTKEQLPLTNAAELLVNLLNSYYVAHNYRDLMNLAAKTQSKGMVADAGQLMAINASLASKHAFIPAYVGKQQYTELAAKNPNRGKQWVQVTQTVGADATKRWDEVNFNQDNPTMLFIGLTLRYPGIRHTKLSKWIEDLMGKREKSGMGFDAVQITRFHQELATMEKLTVYAGLLPVKQS